MTRSRRSFLALALCAVLALAVPAALAADEAKAKPYPLDTCLVSGEKLGDHGEPVVKVHEGQEFKFCCKGCVKDFDKDPAKWHAKLNEEVAKKDKAKDKKG